MWVWLDMNGIAPTENGLVRRRARSWPGRVDDREVRQAPVADRRVARADPPHRSLAVEVVRVHARPGGPALALDLEQRLVGVVAEQLELLEPHVEAELPKRAAPPVGGLRRRVAPGGARADPACEPLDEIHDGQPS